MKATYVGVDTNRSAPSAKSNGRTRGAYWPKDMPGRADTLGRVPVALADAAMKLAAEDGATMRHGGQVKHYINAAVDYTGLETTIDARNAAWCLVALRAGVVS